VRRWRAAALAAILVASGCAAHVERLGQPVDPNARTVRAAGGFTILQMNDVYKIEGLEAGRVGGLARVRTLRRRVEAEGKPVLLLHAGDFLFPSVMSKYLLGEPMIDGLNRLDGNADHDPNFFVTFGNHEFDTSDAGLVLGRVAQSDFTWLASALRYRSGGEGTPQSLATRLTNVAPSRLVELGGIRVGLLAITMDYETRPWLDYGYQPGPRQVAIRAAIDDLVRAGAELLVAVTHQDLQEDCALAREFPELRLIIGGHDHTRMLERQGDTWISKADADARTLVRIDVARGPDGGIATRHSTVTLGPDVPADPAQDALTQRWLGVLSKTVRERTGRQLAEIVATTAHALEGTEPVIRTRETALGNFIADVLRQRLGADIALFNSGAVRINDDIPAGGNLSQYEMEGIFYYDNVPVLFEASGREILKLLEVSASGAHLGAGRFLQISGLRYRYHPDRLSGDRPVLEAADVDVLRDGEYRPLELDRRYRVATLDYLWRNGYRDGYELFAAGKPGGSSPTRLDDPGLPLSWRGITEEAIASLPDHRITSAIEGRIVRVGESPPPAHCKVAP
jgi:2',3'-cyclic-nucleotide 2'-phosphodiesterase (5'-nucleotidase family)